MIVPFDRIDSVITALAKVRAPEAEFEAKIKGGLRSPAFMQRQDVGGT